jgi:photoactive yellow protein
MTSSIDIKERAMDFENKAGLAQLEAMSAQGLDELPFGVVRMRADGEVVAYNAWESKMAGLSKERVLSRNFFSDVAPCTNNFMVAERFLTEPELDATLDYVFTLRMKPTPVKLRLLRSATADHMYLLVNR